MAAPTAYRQANPFTPIFGRVPAYMAGREQIIDDMVLAFENDDSDPNLSMVRVVQVKRRFWHICRTAPSKRAGLQRM